MGRYKSYADRVDTLVRKRFSDYEKALDKYEKAKKARAETPMREGWGVTAEYQLKAKKAEVKYLEAEKDFKEAKAIYQNTLNEVKGIRAELLEAVTRRASADPNDLDRNVVDLLKSGICSAEEIERLFDNAGNATTKRYIAKFADDEYQKIMDSGKMSERSPEGARERERSTRLLRVVQSGKEYTNPEKSEALQIFDHVSEVVSRTINNPAMIRSWGELTEDILSEM